MIVLMVLELEGLVLLIKSKKDVKRLFFISIKLTKKRHNDNIIIGDEDEKQKRFYFNRIIGGNRYIRSNTCYCDNKRN